MEKLYKSASAAVAVIPGITVLASGVWVPPGHKPVFAIVLEVFGIGAWLLVRANKESVQALTARVANGIALALFLGFLAAVVGYKLLFDHCVVHATASEWPGQDPVFFPLSLRGDIAKAVADAGSRLTVVDRFGPSEITLKLPAMPDYDTAILWTKVVLLAVYSGMVAILTSLFGILGLRQPNS